MERELFRTGKFEKIYGVDISKESLEVAREKAHEIGANSAISYGVKNLNSDTLGDNEYDVICISSAAHHIEQLEFFYQNVKKALKKGGIFHQDEYVGAPRFQHKPLILNATNFLIKILPKKFKRWKRHSRVKFTDMLNSDPSEAVRSDEIILLAKKYFPHTRVHKELNIIVHLLYQAVNANEFHNNKRRSVKLAKLAYYTEWLVDKIDWLGGCSGAHVTSIKE